MLQAARDSVVANVGEQFFTRYVRMDSVNTRLVDTGLGIGEPFYRVRYLFTLPEAPWVDGNVTIEFGCEGPPTLRRPIVGLPRCVESPSECSFPITDEDAIRIASGCDLPGDSSTWRRYFSYEKEFATYTWQVWARSPPMDGAPMFSPENVVYIDANDGTVLTVRKGVFIRG